jgi:hypothetical protein
MDEQRTETMWATVERDPFSGRIVWLCEEVDNRGEASSEAAVTLRAEHFPIGTRISITEPQQAEHLPA